MRLRIRSNRWAEAAWFAAGAAAGFALISFLLIMAPAAGRDSLAVPFSSAVLAILVAVLFTAAYRVRMRAWDPERAFWESPDFLATVVNGTADGIIAIDKGGIVRTFNPAAEKMFGYTGSEIVGQNISALLVPDERAKHDEYLRNSTLYKPKVIGSQRTLKGRRKDGTVVPLEISVSTMQSMGGLLFIGVCHDITSRLRAEDALRESEERLQDAIESIQEGFVMYGPDDRLMLCNTRYREQYSLIADVLVPGLEFGEQLRIGVKRGQYPEAVGCADEWIAERMHQHRSLGGQIERMLPDGRWVKIEERRTRSGNTVGVRTDITELKARERQLRESEERYRHLVDLLPDGVMVHVDGIIVLANDAMANILGVENRDNVIGRTEIDFIPPEERDAVLQRRRDAGVNKSVEVRETAYMRHDGIRVEIERSRAVIPWQGKTAFLALARDITERKQAEKDILYAKFEAEKANRVKSAFLANMSHELRTPLNAIIGFSDLMTRESFGPVGSKQYRDYAGCILEAGQHLLDLINDILDLSKVEAGSEELQDEEIDVSELVRSAVSLVKGCAQKADVRLVLDVPDDLPMLYADLRKMKQILVNMLSNGVKFTEAGGSVMIEVCRSPEGGHQFKVRDTGLGIAPEDIAKALMPFGQVKRTPERSHEGTGLGLPLTKKLVELHGGRFALESELGVGTIVIMEFPPERVVPSAAVSAADSDKARPGV